MLSLGLLLLGMSGLVMAQQGITCECYPYYICKDRTTWADEVKCQYHNEVCCTLEAVAVTDSPINTQPTPEPRISDECGIRNKPKKTINPIWKIATPVGDDGRTYYGEFPWMVAILKRTPEGLVFLCGGSIISPNIILTAAHSIRDTPARDLTVKAGVWNTTDIDESQKHQNRKVLQTLIHSGFDKVKIANDVALLVLNEPLMFTENISSVCLPSSLRVINETSCVATGWGADQYGNENGNILKKVKIPIVDFNTCQNKLQSEMDNFNLHDSFICAGGGAAGDTCVGDGGGPFMCAETGNPDRYVQIGITSWGIGCDKDAPGVYASVQAANDWIKNQVELFPSIYPKMSL